jgi:ferric-dicitrate binding protein FerR (iron transport regulator)
MKLSTYSSLAAFIAHYETLRAIHSDVARANVASPDHDAALAAMESIVDELSPADRDALRDASSSSGANSSRAAARHRARAELALHRALAARGLLAG